MPDRSHRPGASFEDSDVVDNYLYRPPYPADIYETILRVSPALDSLLDIGCGPGKISRPLARHFGHVTAVDPSRQMIALGRSLELGRSENIEWVAAFAEDLETERRFDLTVAANSIHWMSHERLFRTLAAHANPNHVMVVIAGDDPHEPAWQADWLAFLGRWVPALTGQPYDPTARARTDPPYWRYLAVKEQHHFISEPFTQSVADFIRCQHSRDTFAPSKMGARLTAFDAELEDLLRPHAADGELTFCVEARLEWGPIECTL